MTTIICIDDDPENRENIAGEIEKADYKVLFTQDGDEALEMILEHIPQLILYNICTAHENRYRILREVRTKYPLLADTPFIFVSDQSNREQLLADLKAGADAFLTRPINTLLLVATIQASLRQIKRIQFKHDNLLVLDI
jgi:CheY-like chemotaxis protein